MVHQVSGENFVDVFGKVINTDKNDNDITLAYNYQCLKDLLLMIMAKTTKEDKFLDKYNSRYITYLFYSFKREIKYKIILYINNYKTSLNDAYVPFITTHFFNNQNNENIYKLFIYFLTILTSEHLRVFNDTDNTKNLFKFENNVLLPVRKVRKITDTYFFQIMN